MDLNVVSDRLAQLTGKWHATNVSGSRCWFVRVGPAAAAAG
jgi:hypothetical protein